MNDWMEFLKNARPDILNDRARHCFKIRQYNLFGYFLADYDSFELASAASDCPIENIKKCAIGLMDNDGRYIWGIVPNA